MGKRIWSLITAIAGLALISGLAHAFSHEFYKDKIFRVVVGFGAGSGFDVYSRAIARHIGKHLPANPTTIVENMPGAGGLIAANHLYKVAKPDGLTIGIFTSGLLMGQLLERPGIEFDALRFEYVGVPVKDNPACALTKASGMMSLEKWMAAKTPVKLGGLGAGTVFDDAAKILKAALGLPIQLVSGYKSTAEVRLAAESGEIAGGCWAWESIKSTWSKGIESGDAVVVVQMLRKAHPELPRVPLAINFVKTEEARQLIQVGIHDMADTTRLYVLPPGTPKERRQIVRKAFMDTMKDPEFLAEAKKSKLDIDPMTGEELERAIHGVFKLSPAMVAKLREVLK